MREIILSLPEKKFILKAAAESKRLDGRKPDDFRQFHLHFGREWGSCFATLGETKVLANVSCEVQEPQATRPNDGLLYINVEVGGMAAPHLEGATRSELGVHLNRMLEKCLKESKAVDLEALCLVADEKVWALRVDINIINYEGNLVDCSAAAALAALAHFRRPDVTLDGQEVTIHDPTERDPIPLTLHHYPTCVSFAYMAESEKILSDPTAIEERVSDAVLLFGINSFREVCALHMGGTAVLPTKHILRCANKAALRAKHIVDTIKSRLAQDAQDRLERRPIGYASCCESEKITSLSQDRVKIQLSKFRLSEALVIPDEAQGNMEVDKAKPDRDEDMDVIPDANKGQCQVIDLGDNTAELVCLTPPKKMKTCKQPILLGEATFGKGGPSQWIVETESVPVVSVDGPDDEITVLPPSQPRRKVFDSVVLDGDSDEEMVVELDSKGMEAAECVKVSKQSQQRQNKIIKQQLKKKGKKNR